MGGADLCVAGAALMRAAAMGERVSITWDSGRHGITFNWLETGWFWSAYDHKTRSVMGSGRAATIEAAVDQARDLTQLRVLAAE